MKSYVMISALLMLAAVSADAAYKPAWKDHRFAVAKIPHACKCNSVGALVGSAMACPPRFVKCVKK